MKSSLRDAQIAALGLENAILGEEERIPLTSPVHGHGFAGPLPAGALPQVARTGDFIPLRSAAAHRVGLSLSDLSERAAVVRIEDDAGAPLFVRAASDAPHVATLPSAVVIDLSGGEPACIERGDQSGLILGVAMQELLVIDFYPAVEAIPALAPVEAPLERWIAECDDEWVSKQLGRCSRAGGSWQNAIGAGLFARLSNPPADAARLVKQLLENPSSVPLPPARPWARALAGEEVATLEDLALAAVDRVSAQLDDLEESMAPGEDWWCKALHNTCVDRDDLECVRVVLAERGARDRIAPALQDLDWRGRRFMATLPREVSFSDERLWRARLGDPTAWWAEAAEPPSL